MNTEASTEGTTEQTEAIFFSTPALEQRLDLLQHLIEFGQPPIVLTGALGAGKSVLITELLARAPEHWRIAILEGQDCVASNADPWALVLSEWGSDASSSSAVTAGDTEFDNSAVLLSPAALAHEQVARWLKADEIPLVIIDDAHVLPNEILVQVLTSLAHTSERSSLRMLLVGESSLEERLRQPPLRAQLPGLVHSLEMPALLATEINDYLLTRQQAAGLAAVRLPDAAAQRLHYETGGLPGPVYERFVRAVAAVAAHEAEPMRRVPSLPRLGEPTTRRYALAMGMVALVFVVSLIWRALPDGGPPDLPSVLETLTLPVPDNSSLKPPTVAVTHLPVEDAAATAPPGPGSPTSAPEPTQTTSPADASVPQSTTINAHLPVLADARSDPSPPEPSVVDQTLSSPQTAPARDSTPIPEPTPTASPPAPQAALETPTAVAEVATQARELESRNSESTKPATNESANAEPAQPSTPKAAPGSDRRWLQDQSAGTYTLQLLASDDGAKARAALTAMGVGDEGHLVKLTRGGRSVYVVLYGSFPDRAAAQAAVAKLPAPARAAKPFPKTFQSLQAELAP